MESSKMIFWQIPVHTRVFASRYVRCVDAMKLRSKMSNEVENV